MTPVFSEAQQTTVQAYLQGLLASPALGLSRRRGELLTYLVERTILGEADSITEYSIGFDVYGKPVSFDPRTDATVRSDVSRLRRALACYYEDAGKADPWRIEFPQRGYVPVISAATAALDNPPLPVRNGFTQWASVAGFVLALLGAGIGAARLVPTRHRVHTVIPEAHALYLTGSGLTARRGMQDFGGAARYFRQAIAVDPLFDAAYAALAEAQILMVLYGTALPVELLDAKQQAEKALALNPRSALAHTSLAAALILNEYDWSSAEREFSQAIALDPNLMEARQWRAVLLLAPRARFQEAHAELRLARSLDPQSPVPISADGWIHYFQRDFEHAISLNRIALEKDPEFLPAYFRLAQLSRYLHDRPAYLAEVRKIRELIHEPLPGIPVFRGIPESLGRALQSEATTAPNPGVSEALVAIEAGEADRAIQNLRIAYDRRQPGLLWVNVDPAFDPIRSQPGYQELMRRIGLLE